MSNMTGKRDMTGETALAAPDDRAVRCEKARYKFAILALGLGSRWELE